MSTTKTAEQKKEFTLTPVFALWKKTSKDGKTYFTGKTESGEWLTGFITTKKKNPNEPDLRVYKQTDDGKLGDVYVSMWCKVSKNNNKYLSGKIGDKWVSGFIRKTHNEKAPYVSVYYNGEQRVEKNDNVKFDDFTNDDELPFK